MLGDYKKLISLKGPIYFDHDAPELFSMYTFKEDIENSIKDLFFALKENKDNYWTLKKLKNAHWERKEKIDFKWILENRNEFFSCEASNKKTRVGNYIKELRDFVNKNL